MLISEYKLAIVLAVGLTAGVSSGYDEKVLLPSGTGSNVTACLQAAIDRVAAAGGGIVRVPRGEYVIGTIRLKDGIVLHLDRNAYLLGSTDRGDYPTYVNEGDTTASLISATGVHNVAVEGEGVIDGRGRLHKRQFFKVNGREKLEPGRNVLYFEKCRGVRVEGVSLRCGSSWACHFRDCDSVTARKIRIWSHCNYSNDGIDIESRNVLIEDCDIDTEDDPLVVKAREPESVVENVRVKNCRLSSNCEHIKIGTETLGTIRDVCVENCSVACRTPVAFIEPWFPIPGVHSAQCGISAISLFLMDGGSVEDVIVRNIDVGEGIMTPICIRYGDRKPRKLPGKGYFRNVLVENVRMSAPSASYVAYSITGLPDNRPSDIVFRNLDLVFKGGGRAKDAIQKITAENPSVYPTPYNVFKSIFPAYAFYVRHADNVRFENVRTTVVDPDEIRPPIVADDATITTASCDMARSEGCLK